MPLFFLSLIVTSLPSLSVSLPLLLPLRLCFSGSPPSASLPFLLQIDYTGCGINPARSFGSSVITHNFKDHWVRGLSIPWGVEGGFGSSNPTLQGPLPSQREPDQAKEIRKPRPDMGVVGPDLRPAAACSIRQCGGEHGPFPFWVAWGRLLALGVPAFPEP